MPQIDPKFMFWFGVWTNVLMLIAGYSVDHAPAIVAQYAPAVQWFCGVSYKINGVILTAMAALSSNKTGVFVSAPAEAPVIPPAIVKVLIAAVLLSAFLFAPPAMAQGQQQPRSLKPIDPLQRLIEDISAKKAEFVANVVAAIQEADDDAGTLLNPNDPTSFRDPISHACYPAQIKFLQSLPQVQVINAKAPYNMIVLFQRKRDLVAQIKAGLPVYLKLGCSALIGDEKAIFLQTLAMIGVGVGAGALTGLFPAAAPFTLPALAL